MDYAANFCSYNFSVKYLTVDAQWAESTSRHKKDFILVNHTKNGLKSPLYLLTVKSFEKKVLKLPLHNIRPKVLWWKINISER